MLKSPFLFLESIVKDTQSKIILALFTFCAVAIIALFMRVNKKGVEIVSTPAQKKVVAEIKKTRISRKLLLIYSPYY